MTRGRIGKNRTANSSSGRAKGASWTLVGKSRKSSRTALIFEETIACIVILGGIEGLVGATPLSDQLHEIQVILLIIGMVTFFASMFIDAIIFREDEEKRQTDEI